MMMITFVHTPNRLDRGHVKPGKLMNAIECDIKNSYHIPLHRNKIFLLHDRIKVLYYNC